MSSFSCGEAFETGACSQVTHHNQQAAVSFDGNVAAPIAPHDLDWIFAPVANDLVNTGFGLRTLENANIGAFDPSPSYSSNVPNHYNRMNTDSFSTGFTPTPALTDSNTIASPPGEAPWGELDIPLASTLPVAEAQGYGVPCGPSAAALPYEAEPAWLFEPGIFAPITSGGFTQMNAPPLGLVELGPSHMLAPTRTKPERHCGNNPCGPTRSAKRKMRRNGVLEAAGPTRGARQTPADRAQKAISDKSEVVERGAGLLAAQTAHEVYHQFLPGPSVQEALMGTAQGQQPWIEGREGGLTLDFTGSAAGQLDIVNTAGDVEGDDGEEDEFPIPEKLTDRQRLLLKATPDERARGAVRALKCVLCPKSGFSKWDSFTRHCDQTEAHPEAVPFCRFCGDFFGRPDARDRHEDKETQACRSVSPAKAEEKRRVTSQLFEEHQREVDAYLRFGGKAVEPFAQKIMRLYPDSSKRGSRSQNRLKK